MIVGGTVAEREREKTYRTPYGGNHKVAGVTAVVDETVRLASFIPPPRDRSHPRKETTHDIDASDTLTRGRSRSSFNRALSSVSRRYLRSATLCFLFLTSPPDRSSNAGGMVIFWCRWWVVQVVVVVVVVVRIARVITFGPAETVVLREGERERERT